MTIQSKLIPEILTVSFNFNPQIQNEASMGTPVISVVVLSGEDDAPEDLISGSPVVSGYVVEQHFKEGLAGVVYGLICLWTNGSGRDYVLQEALAVLDGEGEFGPGDDLELSGELPAYACLDESVFYEFPITGGYLPYGPVTISAGSMPAGWNIFVIGTNVTIIGITHEVGFFEFTIHLEDFVDNVAELEVSTTVAECEVLFVAVGLNAAAASSPDGETWTTVTITGLPAATDLTGVTYGLGLWVVVGNQLIYTSPDLTTWTSRTHPITVTDFSFVLFNEDDGVFVAGTYATGTSDGELISSTDGITWSSVTIPSGLRSILCGDYRDGQYVFGCGGSGGYIAVTADLVSFTSLQKGAEHAGICWGDDEYMVVGGVTGAGSGGETWVSPDGLTGWTHLGSQGGVSYSFTSVTWHVATSLYIVGSTGLPGTSGIWTSPTGVTWTQYAAAFTNALCQCIVQYPPRSIILVGNGGQVLKSTDNVTYTAYAVAAFGSDGIYAIHAKAGG